MKFNLSFFFDPFTEMTKDQIIKMQQRITKGETDSKTGKPVAFPSHVRIIHGGKTRENEFGNYCTLTDIDFGPDHIVEYRGGTLLLHNVQSSGEKGELRHISNTKKTSTTNEPGFQATNCAFSKVTTKAELVRISSSDIPHMEAPRATIVTLSDSTTQQAITGKNLTTLHIDECPYFMLTTEQLWQIRESNEGTTSKKMDFKQSIHENDLTSVKAASNKTLFDSPQP